MFPTHRKFLDVELLLLLLVPLVLGAVILSMNTTVYIKMINAANPSDK